jgi:class 3 adenylate cyclase
MAEDERFIDWMAKFSRQALGRNEVVPLIWCMNDYDLVDVFPAVRTPTLVVHRRDDRLVPVSQGRWIAQHIPDAQLVELEGADHLPFVGDADDVLAAIEEFLIGSNARERRHRKLLTIMFTDIDDSSMMLAHMGDDAWRELVAAHDRMVRDHLARFDGQEVKHLGDGFLAIFDAPVRAIRCAMGIQDAAERLGLSVRVGMHTGECELAGDDVRGITVHVGARIVELAAPGQIMVSNSVRDLVAGSGIRFDEGNDVELQGIAGPRVVFAVLRHGATPDVVRRLAIDMANVLRRDGEYWTVAYDGMVVTLRDSKGLRDIRRLLESPQREFHVLDLIAEAAPSDRSVSPSESLEVGLRIDRGNDEPVIDDATRAAYRRRLSDLEREIADAQSEGNVAAATTAREEYDSVLEQLTTAYGLGGKARRTPDHIERARKTVARRIRDAVSRIERSHPGLGRHLSASLHTGVFCSYQPEHSVTWTVTPT